MSPKGPGARSSLPATLSLESIDSTGPAHPPPAENGMVAPLIDGATPEPISPTQQYRSQMEIAADPARSLDDRLSAYEDIMDSDVGDTNLSRARNLERDVGLRQIYLKFEGGNPSGTQKDRIAFAQVRDALRRRFDGLTVATCGNYGAAISMAASLGGLRCVIFLPESYHTRRLPEMLQYGAEVIPVPGAYEDAVLLSRERAAIDELYDANPGGANADLQLEAYGQIAFEIYDELRDAPAAVALPVSNGTTLAGIYKGFLSLYRRGKTSRFPRMIAGSSFGKNPIIQAFLKSTPHCEDLDPKRMHETAVNEPLINWHSYDGDHALEAIRRTGGWADHASDKDLLAIARMLREKEGITVLPASTAGLHVLLERHRRETLPGDRYVIVVTGRKT